jgi:general secretion pathway protein B
VSYILDALRRADAERERGTVPNLHAQSVLPAEPDDAPRRAGRPLVWVVAGLSVALLASLAWQFLGRESARETPDANVSAQAPMSPPPQPAMQPAQPAAPAPSMSLPPVPAAPAPAQVPRATLPPVPAVVAAPAIPPAVKPAPTTTTAAASAAPSPVPAASASMRIPTQDELPSDIRSQLPKFVVGGSIYSDSAASRFLILNGQVFHENDKVATDLVLEQIKLKTAVLRYKNQRFSISY